MCKICADAVNEYFPDTPDSEYGDFLMTATAFPACDGNHVRKQLKEHKEAGCVTYKDAMTRAMNQMDETIERLRKEGKWPTDDRVRNA